MVYPLGYRSDLRGSEPILDLLMQGPEATPETSGKPDRKSQEQELEKRLHDG